MSKEKCNAIIQFGDDYGDNCATFHCRLLKGHKGKHKETGDMGDEKMAIPYLLEWEGSNEDLR